MKQEIARSMNGIVTAATTAIKGAEEHGETIGLKHCTATVMTALRTAAVAARLLFDNAKKALREKKDVLEPARLAARAFATVTRDILKPIFGSEYNPLWDAVGFVDSLAIPTEFEDLLPLMERIVAFLTNNPGLEVDARNVTAAQAQVVYTALVNAFNDVTLQEAAVGTLRAQRDVKMEALRTKLSEMTAELSLLLDPLDARWSAFGFNKPGAEETPDQVEGVQATLIGPTAAAMKWHATARADYYRVWKKVIGVDQDPVAVGTPADLDFTIEGLPAGSTIEIYVSAVNNGGEGPLSEKATLTTHA